MAQGEQNQGGGSGFIGLGFIVFIGMMSWLVLRNNQRITQQAIQSQQLGIQSQERMRAIQQQQQLQRQQDLNDLIERARRR